MKKILLIFSFFLISCSKSTVTNDFEFNNDMSFDDFKIKLEEYAKNNPYPNIDD
tara:strand:- start:58 stop:219 length:162 start_codon:yes stop_codon:yes gene_type:complete